MAETRRRTARGAAVATAVLLGGMIPGAQAASGTQQIDAELAYTCAAPGGEQHPVEVGLSAEVADSAHPGDLLQPEGVTLDVRLPETVLAGVPGEGAATVTAATRLFVAVSQDGRRAGAQWRGATPEPVPVPESGGPVLSTTGSVPYLQPTAAGELVLDAGALTVELGLKRADGTPAGAGTIVMECVLDPGRDATLAKIPVTGGSEGGDGEPEQPRPTETWPGGDKEAGAVDGRPEVGTAAEPSTTGGVPPCVGDPNAELGMVAYVTGYANVTKLDGATRFPVACARITQGLSRLVPDGEFLHILQDSAVDLEYEGKPQLPPASGTFLTFGFMPTTATLEMTQIPPATNPDGTREANIKSDLAINLAEGSTKAVTAVTLQLMLRLRDVEVNGVPLDVGDDCRTSKPFTLRLEGRMTLKDGVQVGYTLATGGELTGSVTLPPFSGCGAHEDLDSLFTASLSGVPGYVKQVQGAPCAAVSADPTFCTPDFRPTDVPTAAR
ncbi:DUF6801 domain-containing protein [Streptomyces sp. NPDC001822]|uniref:DUF6801 domain-containing protein n=1 Tax=Streptomyces sp. NPDC001822 TaxID=3364614 RepID=UPI00369D8A30